jgi:hypothetical protein
MITWILGIIGTIAAIIYGMYELGPGMNKRKAQKKNKEWIDTWKDQNKKK